VIEAEIHVETQKYNTECNDWVTGVFEMSTNSGINEKGLKSPAYHPALVKLISGHLARLLYRCYIGGYIPQQL
jgi:hypothetical protein